ncbi:hypothetical protein OV090_05985 [Nannocystis sp. RBIL2]|uniref:hypothetical protein n=1 Tax=Nannocystis sp. RBIL2 TaxID=2996788 RepID=UPI00226F2B69|nr:hypothetical protein [Nannocystis sp. RBIL2]MCY1064299.1 hypothetical protein [Nannocystis sp. RBIL2]
MPSRPSVVPAPAQQLPLRLAGAADHGPAETTEAAASLTRRLGWANRLARVFAVDVTICRKCGGRMRVAQVVTDPDEAIGTSSAGPGARIVV